MHINRTSFYYTPRPESAENLEIMRIMDEYHYDHPTTGKIGFTDYLKSIGYHVNVKRVQRLMKVMDITAIYPRRSLTHQGVPKYIHPYLLRNLNITHPNQVWSIDITYIPMKNGFMYLYAIIDVYSRYIVGWHLSNSLSASNCRTLLQECIDKYGTPEIVNSDQGSQFTTKEWEGLLTKNVIKISMDGKGRCKDNIWIERFWRTIKHEYIYCFPTEIVSELRKGIDNWMAFYNHRRPHQGIDHNIPGNLYNLQRTNVA